MDITINEYKTEDIEQMIHIWNEVVKDGVAFPQLDYLTRESGKIFFKKQDFVAVARYNEQIVGLYILHPNNVGRCEHQCNTSYAVDSQMRGLKIGEALVAHSLKKAKDLGYKLLIFNAVVKSNNSAIHIYEKLGFHKIGEVPNGFLLKDGTYQDTVMYYYEL